MRAGVPVRELRVEVVAGPSAGLVHVSDGDRVSVGSGENNDVVVADPTVSRFHVELRRRGDRVVVLDLGSTNGTAIGPVRLQQSEASVPTGTVLELGSTQLKVTDGRITLVEPGPAALGELRGRSTPMRRLFTTLERVAKSPVPVLVLGESGTGKELIGRALHDSSTRAEEPFVTVDCGALSPTLAASELFGHERGAFTGADRRHVGAFERADKGTLFLDEVGELTPELQASLLGVLERGRLRRLGGKEEVAVDVRVVSATHRDLRAEVNRGTFRLDLFYRLAVVLVEVPPLRERLEDLPMLVAHFLERAGCTEPVEAVFDEAGMEQLRRHSWPGNVRELRNVVLGTLALGATPKLTALGVAAAKPDAATDESLHSWVRQLMDLPYREAKQVVTDAFERVYAELLLERAGGNIRQAAREGRINRSYLMELLKRHSLRAGG